MDFERSRERMVETQIVSRGVRDERIIEAMKKVPRHLFVEEALQSQAYGDFPLPIGEKQTISQPYIVALMTEALSLKSDEKVLEIGTGSGYQTAIIAEVVYKVYSIERIASLAREAKKRLESLGYYNVMIKINDGTEGWEEESPFDAIIVTAGAPNIPEPLLNQLKIGGRMVIPIGDKFSQSLILVIKNEGGMERRDLGGCRFVKLIGKHGWNK
jgi:protein-L-isoaspartate(D-aspartate) O-methyltransferase